MERDFVIKDNKEGCFLLEEYKHTDKQLWWVLGSLVTSRTIRKELGIVISSDDNYTWWVAKWEGIVVGFGAVALRKEVATLYHSYVFENFRNRGIYSLMLKRRVEFIKTQKNIKKIVTTATKYSKPILEKFGFYETSKRGKYFNMILLDKPNKTEGK